MQHERNGCFQRRESRCLSWLLKEDKLVSFRLCPVLQGVDCHPQTTCRPCTQL